MSVETSRVTGLKVLDEGVTIANPAQSINFVGAGVTASVSGQDVTATIPGGGSTTQVVNEVLGTGDNSTTVFNLAHTPTAGTVAIYKNGIRMQLTGDYTISGGAITFLIAPEQGANLTADYYY